MITEFISKLAVKILDTAGYPGAAFLMGLESMIAPVPSEAVMPFVGFQVADGKWNLGWAIAATSAGSILGSWLSYFMGYYGGKPFILKVGKYLLLNRRDLELTEQFFKRAPRHLDRLHRSLHSCRPALQLHTRRDGPDAGLGPFLAVTLLGATLWNTFLLVCGMKLREHWHVVQQSLASGRHRDRGPVGPRSGLVHSVGGGGGRPAGQSAFSGLQSASTELFFAPSRDRHIESSRFFQVIYGNSKRYSKGHGDQLQW